MSRSPQHPPEATPQPAQPAVKQITVQIVNARGLHARAAAKFVALAAQFRTDILVWRTDHPDTPPVAGQSIMGLMMLAAGPGSMLTLSAAGEDADSALATLADLIRRRFDES